MNRFRSRNSVSTIPVIAVTAAAGTSRLYSCRLAKQRNPHKVEHAEHGEHPVQQAQPPVIQVVPHGADDGHRTQAPPVTMPTTATAPKRPR